MTTPKAASSKRPAASWKTPGSPDELPPVGQLAHSIVSERPDLLPSVERIMVAALDDEGRLRALRLFSDSLHTPGDPNRDPRVAIARCQADAAGSARVTSPGDHGSQTAR